MRNFQHISVIALESKEIETNEGKKGDGTGSFF
jgi:hypothetical protein